MDRLEVSDSQAPLRRGRVFDGVRAAGARWGRVLLLLLVGFAVSLSPRSADAQFLSKVGSLVAPSSGNPTPSQSITGVGFQPRAVIFFWTAQSAGGFATNASAGYGFATGAGSERAVGFASDDNLGAGANNPARWQWTTRCIAVVANAAAATVDAQASLASMDVDGFTINWVRGNTAWIIHYLALGGPDITNAAVGSFTPTAGTGSQSVGGLAFSPQFLMFLSIDSNTVGSRVTPDGKVSLGHAGLSNTYGITQGATTAVSRTGGANIITSNMQRADAALLEKATNVLGVEFVASVTSFDPNGFTINKTVNVGGTETPVHYLALRGGQYRVGAITRPSTAGPSTRAYGGVGFTPHGLLFSSYNLANQAVPDEEARISFSAADSALSGTPLRYGQRATFFHDKLDTPGSNDNSWVRQATSGSAGVNGKLVYLAQAGDCPPNPLFSDPPGSAQCSGGPRLISDADLASYDAGGFTLSWTTNDLANMNQLGGDEENAQVLYVAFGPPPPQTNYRSIGTAGNVSGTLNATNGSTLVSDLSASWQTANRGRGDRILIGGTPYVVRNLNSQTQLTLTTPFAAATGPYAYTISRQFTTLAAWENCVDGTGNGGSCPVSAFASNDLRADHRREVGIAYDDNVGADFVLTSPVDIDGSVTDVTHTITLTADGGNRHNGIPGAGVIVDANLGPNEIQVRDSNVTVEWLELVRLRGGAARGVVRVVETAPADPPQNVLLQNLLIHDFLDTTATFDISGIRLSGDPGKSVTIRNTMVWNGDRFGLEADEVGDALTIENCSIDNMPDTTDGSAAGIYAANTTGVLVKNTIVTRTGTNDYQAGSGSFSAFSTNNVSEDTGAGGAPGANAVTNVVPANVFVSPGSDLHLKTGSVAIDSGVSLSGFFNDIDGGLRPAGLAWDRGADEYGATTAVELMSFVAVAGDGSVLLEWRTGSELDNLGFHVYRGSSGEGPWTRLTSSLIPGLGSSPLGRAYSWLDTGLTNGVRYYYRLEDVDTASVSTFHGPVSAVPVAASSPPGEGGGDGGGGDGTGGGDGATVPGSCPEWILAAAPEAVSASCTAHGNPEAVSLQVLSRRASGATLELQTGGFWTLEDGSGTVRVFVPGLGFPADANAPALPVRRALVDAVVGKQVRLVSAQALELQSFPGLRPSAVGEAEMAVGRDGTIRPSRRFRSARFLSRGLVPQKVARLAGTVFQGEKKSAVVEITPVRFSAARNALVLAGRVRVRLSFARVAEGELPTRGGGRALPRKEEPQEVLAQLHTARRGLHAVRYEDLFPTSRRGVSTTLLRLQRQGEAVSFHVEPSGPEFGPGSVLYFDAERTVSSTEYSGEVAYELVRGAGERMGVVSAAPAGAPLTSPATGFASFETNRIYQPGLLEAADIWLWDAMATRVVRTEVFALSGVDVTSPDPAHLVVFLQGGSESGVGADHHVQFSVNGSYVGETTFTGKQPQRVDVLVPVSLLREGSNELSVANVGDTGVYSLVFLDRFELSYPQAAAARGGVFEGVWAQSGTVEVGGLSGPPVILRDTCGPAGSAVKWLTGFQLSGSSVRFQAEAGYRYTVVSPEGLHFPRIGRVPASTLKAGTNQADYLVIAPREFLEAAQPLVERRSSQGLVSRAVPFEEIASEFGHGQPSAEAIRAFLEHAYHSWQAPSPRYVVLLGDATYDPRRFLATSSASPLPALWEKTSYLWTVSDPALAAVNGEDFLPDLAIGRLPATSREQAQALVSKLLAWEDSGQGLSGDAVLVADVPDKAGDFEANVEDIHVSFLAGRSTTTLKVRELGAGTRPAILGAFDRGSSLMSYVGHGGTAVWSSANVLNSWDTPSLLAQSRQPLLLTMNCLNGYFVAPRFDSLSESLVKVEGRGAVAAFSPSGLSLDGPAHQYHRALMAELAGGTHERLGDAILAAQRTYAETGLMPELLTVYQLLGDPATRIR